MKRQNPFVTYGILGYPAKHSLSPVMHNAAFRALKINAEYKIFELRPEDLESFFSSIFKKNIYGLNITIPYKERIMSFLDSISKEVELIGAVNTIKIDHNRLEGFNTDGEGFLRHLVEGLGFNPEGATIAILGAGGAAKAVSFYLSKAKPQKIAIYDIDKTKTVTLTKRLKENFNNIEFKIANSIEELNIMRADLLINATAIGMKEADPCLVDGRFIHKKLLVYDLIYNPQKTKLIMQAKEKGASVSNGLGMLLYQGMLSFERWTGKKAPQQIMWQALQGELQKCGKS